MMYGFTTLNDGTEINHSEAKIIDGKEVVKVYIERPVTNGFNSAECYLPAYDWENIVGFSKYEIEQLQDFIKSVAHIIIELAREGGFAKKRLPDKIVREPLEYHQEEGYRSKKSVRP